MNQSVKAALLSGLIFPGIGQISLGYKKRGWLFVTANIVFICLIISEVIQQAYSVVAEMQKNGTIIDADTISKASSTLVSFSDNLFLNILLLLLIAIWLVSIVDAYRLGKNK